MGTNTHTSMIDLHCHILHEIDDGSANIEMSIEMIKKQINDGVTTIVLTPHMRSFKPEKVSKIRHNFEQLKEKVKEQNLDVRLLLGSEVYYTKESLSNKHLMTIENTSYVLVEFSTILETPIEEIVYNFRTLKIRPIVAHVERYGYLRKKDYTEIKKTGGLIQVNSSAILGLDGYKRKKMARYLLKKQLVDVVATDSHNLGDRKPNLKEAFQFVVKKYSKEYAKKIFEDNPKRIILNESI